MRIPVVLGTAREGRQSEKVANFILEEVKKVGLETELIDVRDYRIAATNNTEEIPEAQKLSPKFDLADAFIIVAPEYNHGYPGELKMFLDMLYDQYAKKPVGLCGVSRGALGGARVVEQLRLVAAELHMVSIREALYFPTVQNLFDENGKIKDGDSYKDRVKNFLDELIWYAGALAKARSK
jgi:NAD(P)H-dependent FMN reductase